MAARSSPVSLVALIGLLAILAATGWLLLMSDEAPQGPGSGAPLVLDSGPAEPAEPSIPEPVVSRPPPIPVEPPSPRTGRVTGKLVNRDRVPIEGGLVSLHRGLPGFMGTPLVDLGPSTRTNAGGVFTFEDVDEQAQLVVRAQGDGFSVTDSGPHRVVAQDLTDIGTIVARPGVVISGVVLDELGRTLAGAEITIDSGSRPGWGQADSPPLRRTTSDADGRFEIAQAPQPPVLVKARAPGYAQAGAMPEAEAAAGLFSVTLQLQPAASLRGRVMAAEDERPLAGVEVRVQSSSLGQAAWTRTTSDDEGLWVVEDMPRGRCLVLADAPGRVERQLTIPAEQFDQEVLLRLNATYGIQGRVVDADDQPVRAFDIRARTSSKAGAVGEPAGPVQRTREPNGRFTLTDLAPGYYLLEVWAKGFAVTLGGPVRVRKGADTVGVSVTVQPPSTLVGLVENDVGEPLSSVDVSLHSNNKPTIDFLRETDSSASWMLQGRTGKEGRFQLENATAGLYQVQLEHPDYPPIWINDVLITADGEEDMGTLVLPRPATVEGTLIDEAGQVLRGATVFLSGGDMGHTSRRAATDGEGRYRFDRLPPGAYYIEAHATMGNPMSRIGAKLQRIQMDAAGGPRLAPDVVLQAGDEVEHLVRAGH